VIGLYLDLAQLLILNMKNISGIAYITCQHAMTIIKYICDKNEINMSIYSEIKYSTQMKEIFPVHAIKTEYRGE